MDTPASLHNKRIGCIGCGNMGGAILGGLAGRPGLHLFGYNRTPKRLEPLLAKGVKPVADIPGLVAASDIVIIGVKPYLVAETLQAALPALRPESVVISIAAGVTLRDLREVVQNRCHVVRVMPNTPAAIGRGMLALSAEAGTPEARIQAVEAMLAPAGLVERIAEGQMDAFSAVAGCGPAFVYPFIEALADGGVLVGLPRGQAMTYAAQMVLGAAALVLESGKHPGQLKDEVCSPGGSTIAGVAALEARAFRSAVIEAVEAAYRRTVELGKV